MRAAEPRKQKPDRRDAELILKLLVENGFPTIGMPSQELLDLRALLLHRHPWVRLGTRIQNALQAIALANGLRRGPGLWSYAGQAQIAFLPLPPYAAARRSALQARYRKRVEEIEKLTQPITEPAAPRCGPRLLRTHPGVGPVTARGS
jgi:transposase